MLIHTLIQLIKPDRRWIHPQNLSILHDKYQSSKIPNQKKRERNIKGSASTMRRRHASSKFKKKNRHYGERDSENNVQSSMSLTSSSGMFHFSGSFRQSSLDRKCRTWKMTCRVTDTKSLLNISRHVNQFTSVSKLMHGTSAIDGRHIAGRMMQRDATATILFSWSWS
jgi:hypothetical protein